MIVAFSSDHHHHAYQRFARILPGGVNSRVAEMLAVETYMREQMIERRAPLHVRGGDLFEKKNQIDAVVFAEVANQIRANGDAGIEEVIDEGNHDEAAGGIRNSLEALTHIGNVRVVPTSLWVPAGDLNIAMVAYDHDADVQKKFIAEMAEQARRRGGKNMLVAHLQIRGCKSGSEHVLPGALTTDDLCLDAWDYVFCGHVHEPQWLTNKTLYIGSMSQRSFQDEGAQRRMLFLDTETMQIEEVPLPGPRFVTLEVHDPDQLAELCGPQGTVRATDYYKVVLMTPAVKTPDVDALMDGRAAGWLVTQGKLGPASQPRLSPTLSRWDDICDAYVQASETKLDQTRLLQVAADLRSSASVKDADVAA
jgi:hypothetical protein